MRLRIAFVPSWRGSGTEPPRADYGEMASLGDPLRVTVIATDSSSVARITQGRTLPPARLHIAIHAQRLAQRERTGPGEGGSLASNAMDDVEIPASLRKQPG